MHERVLMPGLFALIAACSSGGGGGVSDGGVSWGGTGHTGGAGSGGAGGGGGATGGSAGGSGACWIPTQFPIEVATAGSAIADFTATQAELDPYVCLAAAVWPVDVDGFYGSPWDTATTTKPEKFYLSQAAPTPAYIYNMALVAALAPERPEGFAAGKWRWEVFRTSGPECAAVGEDHNWAHYFDQNQIGSGLGEYFSLEALVGGVFTIECGQLPFVAKGQVLWNCGAYPLECTAESNNGGTGGTGGSGGSAGNPCAPASGDTACTTCAKTACCPEFSAMAAHPDYPAYASCANACSTDACQSACLEAYPSLKSLVLDLALCQISKCQAACTQ